MRMFKSFNAAAKSAIRTESLDTTDEYVRLDGVRPGDILGFASEVLA
jgi:hypothetical protein